MNKTNKKGIGCFIFHRDLRIQDNKGLIELCKLCDIVIPIFVFTPIQVDNDKNNYKSLHSVRFMIESLSDLNDSLNNRLLTFYGELTHVLKRIYSIVKFDYIGFNQDITPFSKNRSKTIKKVFDTDNCKVYSYNDYYLCNLDDETLLRDGNPYVKFSAFERRAIEYLINNTENILIDERTQIIKNKIIKNNDNEFIKLKNIDLYISLENAYIKFIYPTNNKCCKGVLSYDFNVESMEIWKGERKTAINILDKIRKGDYDKYNSMRNDLNYNTTQLSAFIKYGLISIREMATSILKIKINRETKLNYNKLKENSLFRQLIWREFYAMILYHIPRVLKEPFQKKYFNMKWENNTSWTQKWKEGRTGFPIIDACMTQLNTTGYMHNRGRLIVSSFLIKILLTDWRIGEHYFASMLVDYDPSNNNGNWQWVAGTGTDSMPYFRIFNPWIQSEKYDTDAKYIKQWLPQLQDIPAKHLHEWYKYYMEYDLKNINYEKPIVDYKERVKNTIKVYKSV